MYDSMTPTRLIYLFHIDLKSTFKSYTVMKFIGAKLAVPTHIKGWMNTMALGASSFKIKIVFSKIPGLLPLSAINSNNASVDRVKVLRIRQVFVSSVQIG